MKGTALIRRTALGAALCSVLTGVHAEPSDHGRHHQRDARHIFVIVMENHGVSEIIGNTADAPFINRLIGDPAKATDGMPGVGVATQYYGVTHPSLPNYLALFSGSYQGIFDDCKAGATVYCAPEEFVPGSGDATDGHLATVSQVANATNTAHLFYGENLVDQLEQRGKRWKAYMQAMPAVGYDGEYAPVINGAPVKLYAQKHNPFMYFADIHSPNNPRLKNIVPFDDGAGKGLAADLNSGDVADFVWISPDQCHDMHGISAGSARLAEANGYLPGGTAALCGYPDSGLDHGAIQLGDKFLQDTVGAIQSSKAWTEGSAIVIVWDEDDYAGAAGCCGSPEGVNHVSLGGARAPLIVITNGSAPRRMEDHPLNHYALLAGIEDVLGLSCLEETCRAKDVSRVSDLLTP